MTSDPSKEALDALVYRFRRWDITDDDKEKAADAITALRAEVEALQREVNEQESRANENKARATAAETARQEALMQSIADAGQAQEAHDARLKAEAARDAAMAGAVRVNVDKLSNVIRSVDGGNALGASALAEAIAARILSALEPNPAPIAADGLGVYLSHDALAEMDAEREALIAAALEQAANLCDDTAKEALDESGVCSRVLHVWFAGQAKHLRALATKPQTDALAARDSAMRAEGMRMAAEIATDFINYGRVGTIEYIKGQDECAHYLCDAILAAAEKEQSHD